MSVLYANNAEGLISASITSSTASISLSTGQGALFPAITGSNYFYATIISNSSPDFEIVKVTARVGDTLTVERGQDGTTAKAFAVGSQCQIRITKALLDALKSDAVTEKYSTPWDGSLILSPNSGWSRTIGMASGTNTTLVLQAGANVGPGANLELTSDYFAYLDANTTRMRSADGLTSYVQISASGLNVLTGPLKENNYQVLHANNFGSYAMAGAGFSANQNLNTTNTVQFDQVVTNNNGNGTNVKIGDDAWIGDINVVNTLRVAGGQDPTKGYIVFGNGDNTALGRSGAGALTYGGNTILHSGNFSSYTQAALVSGTNIKTINGASILGSGDLVISGGGGGTSGLPLTGGTLSGNLTIGSDPTSNVSALNLGGYNAVGGTGYHGFLALRNTYGSATNPNKWFRLTATGDIQIINSAYSSTIFQLSDAGVLSNVTMNASVLTSGTVNTARLGSGTANNTTYLRGDGTWATVAGASAASSTTAGILFGSTSSATAASGQNGTVSLGFGTITYNPNTYHSVAIGLSAELQTSAQESIAIGAFSKTKGYAYYAIALGTYAEAGGEGTIAIGRSAKSTGAKNIVLGHNAYASYQTDIIVIGANSSAGTSSAVSIGRNNSLSNRSVAIGPAINDNGYASIILSNNDSGFAPNSDGFFVDGMTSGSASKVLYYDTTTKKISYGDASGGSLASLSGVSITNPTAGQVLKFNGTVWANAADETGGSETEPTVTVTTSTRIAPDFVMQSGSYDLQVGFPSPAMKTYVKETIIALAAAAQNMYSTITLEFIYQGTSYYIPNVGVDIQNYMMDLSPTTFSIGNYYVQSYSVTDGRPASTVIRFPIMNTSAPPSAGMLNLSVNGNAGPVGTVFATNKPYGVYLLPGNYQQAYGSFGNTTSPTTSPLVKSVTGNGNSLVIESENTGPSTVFSLLSQINGGQNPYVFFMLGLTETTTSSGGTGGGTTPPANVVAVMESVTGSNGTMTVTALNNPTTTSFTYYAFDNFNGPGASVGAPMGMNQFPNSATIYGPANSGSSLSVPYQYPYYNDWVVLKWQGVENFTQLVQQTGTAYYTFQYYHSDFMCPSPSWFSNYGLSGAPKAMYMTAIYSPDHPYASFYDSIAVASSFSSSEIDITRGQSSAIPALGNATFKFMLIRFKPAFFSHPAAFNSSALIFTPPSNQVTVEMSFIR